MEKSKEYDNDAVGLDAVKMHATTAFPAGVFASYHAYPYYPEFLVVDPGYSKARSPEGPSNYFGYLRELVAHHGDMPVVISEYGVPSSRGIGHFQPQGWNHGGLSEQQQALADARLTRDIYASGAAGAGLFALIDEWFKKNWIVIDFEYPPERKRLWLNPLDAEENYGVIAMRAGRKDARKSRLTVTARIGAADPCCMARLPRSSAPAPLQLKSLRVAQDEAYVYLRLDVGRIDWARAHYQIGIDTYRREPGRHALPAHGLTSAGRARVRPGSGRTRRRASCWSIIPTIRIVRSRSRAASLRQASTSTIPPFRIVANDLGQWDSLVVVPNRRRIGRDGNIYHVDQLQPQSTAACARIRQFARRLVCESDERSDRGADSVGNASAGGSFDTERAVVMQYD